MSKGYFFEIIIILKNPNAFIYNKTYTDVCSQLEDRLLENDYLKSYNFINETLFKEYNKIFDEIYYSIKINETENDSIINLNYENLCPKRLNKCAVEGGIMRANSFQRNLLNRELYYDWNDSTK